MLTDLTYSDSVQLTIFAKIGVAWLDKLFHFTYAGHEYTLKQLCVEYQAHQAYAIWRGIKAWDEDEAVEDQKKAKKPKSQASSTRATAFLLLLEGAYGTTGSFWDQFKILQRENSTVGLIADNFPLKMKSKNVKAQGKNLF